MPLPFERKRIRISAAGQIMFAAVMCVMMAGCGNGLADVSGTVTLDGQPLRGGEGIRATVQFVPVSGTGASAVGIVGEDGHYRLSTGSEEGVKPGDYVATCSATQIIPPKDPNGTPGGRRISDPKYANAQTSGFNFTVQSGTNEFDLAITSPKGLPQRAR